MTWPSQWLWLINLRIEPKICIVTNLTNNFIIHQGLKSLGKAMPRDQSKSLLRAIASLSCLATPVEKEESHNDNIPACRKRKKKNWGFWWIDLLAPSSFSLQVSTPLPLDFALPPTKMSYLIKVSHMTHFGQQYMSGSNSMPISSLSHILACPPEFHLEKSVPQ